MASSHFNLGEVLDVVDGVWGARCEFDDRGCPNAAFAEVLLCSISLENKSPLIPYHVGDVIWTGLGLCSACRLSSGEVCRCEGFLRIDRGLYAESYG